MCIDTYDMAERKEGWREGKGKERKERRKME